MEGYILFLEKFNNLNYNTKLKVISNIFNRHVLVFNILKFENNVYIKFYDGNIYFQFCFLFDNNKDANNLKIEIKDRIVLCNIYVMNTSLDCFLEGNFYNFIQILRSGDINLFDSFL